MTSTRILTVTLLFGVLTAGSVLAQDGRARPRNPGTAREWAGGGPGTRGGRVDTGGDRGRPSGPRQTYRAPDASRYRPAAPAYRDGRGRDDRRGYQSVPRYSRPGVVGRAVPRPYGYVGPRQALPPRYVAPGWRGGWNNTRGWGYYHPQRGWYDPYRRGWFGTRVFVTPRFIRPTVLGVLPYEPFYYRPSLGLGVTYGAGGLAPFGAIPPAYYNPSSAYGLGGLRITDAPRDAQVFVDGAYAGLVDDFDGVFQHINLEGGQHRIELHHPNFPPLAFDVFIEPGRTVTLRADW